MKINTCEHCLKVFTAYRFKRLCNLSRLPLEASTCASESIQGIHIGNGNTRTRKRPVQACRDSQNML